MKENTNKTRKGIKMTLTVKKDLDIIELYNNILDEFCGYDACQDIGLCDGDITPELLKEIFAALSQEAANRE